MKKTIVFLLILICTTLYAQKQSIYLTVGKPWYPDKVNNLNNYSLGLNYQNRFSQSFGFDTYIEYAQSNDFPSFSENASELNTFLMSQTYNNIHFNSLWSEINSINIGAKLNYLFVNNEKFLFNFNLGIGHLFTYSKSHVVNNWTYNFDTGEILAYENETISDNLNTFYYTLGLQFQYTFYKEYFIGINSYYLMPIGEKKINTIPVYPNYYNLTLNIGKKF
jgi:hypothetical protein